MKEAHLTLPELALVVGTRAALGAGLGLLLADRLPEGQRKAVGWTLVLIGAVTTVPLAIEVFGKFRDSSPTEWPEPSMAGL
jgi:uncharacterized membrane protein YfcA